MDWIQFATFLIVNGVFTLTLWLWSRSESRADNREIMTLIRSIHDEMKDFREKWAQETKDFHGRLCAIEERRIKLLER
jgi:hypothetical protein